MLLLFACAPSTPPKGEPSVPLSLDGCVRTTVRTYEDETQYTSRELLRANGDVLAEWSTADDYRYVGHADYDDAGCLVAHVWSDLGYNFGAPPVEDEFEMSYVCDEHAHHVEGTEVQTSTYPQDPEPVVEVYTTRMTWENEYDDRQRLTTVDYHTETAETDTYTWSYDVRDVYTYDDDDRLVRDEESGDSASVTTWGYGDDGLLMTVTIDWLDGRLSTSTNTYDDADRLVSEETVTTSESEESHRFETWTYDGDFPWPVTDDYDDGDGAYGYTSTISYDWGP